MPADPFKPSDTANNAGTGLSQTSARGDDIPGAKPGQTGPTGSDKEPAKGGAVGGDKSPVSAPSGGAGVASGGGAAPTISAQSSDTNAAKEQKNKSGGQEVTETAKDAASRAAAVGEKAQSAVSDAGREAERRAGEASTAAAREMSKRKDEIADEADRATDEVQSGLSEVADQAKTAVSSVAAAVSDKAQHIIAGASEELEEVIEERKAEGAEYLRRFAGAIDRASRELEEEFPAVADYVKRGASRVDALAEVVKDRAGRALATETGNVVRRHPARVAGLLGLAGFAAVRFLMASPSRSGPDHHDLRNRNDGDSDRARKDRGEERSSGRPAAGTQDRSSGDPGGIAPAAPGFGSATEAGRGTTSGAR